MSAKQMLGWCWREVLSVVLIGALGMVLFDLAWVVLQLGQPLRPFLLLAGVATCAWLHPRLCGQRKLRAAHAFTR